MQLDLGPVERGQGVGERVRVVREGARVDDDRRAVVARVLNGVDDLALVIGLDMVERVAVRLRNRTGVTNELLCALRRSPRPRAGRPAGGPVSTPVSKPGVLDGRELQTRRSGSVASTNHRLHQGGPTWQS